MDPTSIHMQRNAVELETAVEIETLLETMCRISCPFVAVVAGDLLLYIEVHSNTSTSDVIVDTQRRHQCIHTVSAWKYSNTRCRCETMKHDIVLMM